MGNNLQVVRVVGTNAKNASTEGSGILVKNETDFETKTSLSSAFVAKYPGTLGNALAVYVFDGSLPAVSRYYHGFRNSR